jgi:hypothetical protein
MNNFEPIPEETERIATQILDCAFKVHRALGPAPQKRHQEDRIIKYMRKRSVVVVKELKST